MRSTPQNPTPEDSSSPRSTPVAGRWARYRLRDWSGHGATSSPVSRVRTRWFA